jgi:hypothetical protein
LFIFSLTPFFLFLAPLYIVPKRTGIKRKELKGTKALQIETTRCTFTNNIQHAIINSGILGVVNKWQNGGDDCFTAIYFLCFVFMRIIEIED